MTSILGASRLICQILRTSPENSLIATTSGTSSTATYSVDVKDIISRNGEVYVCGSFTGTVDFDLGAGVHNVTAGGTQDGYVLKLTNSGDFVSVGAFVGNIYPREIEEVLLTHPSVAEVSVIGRPDAEWGEVVVAYVVVHEPVDAAALDAHCLRQLARFKRPKHYRFVPALPKNHYGKVLKTTLREMDRPLAQGDHP